MIFQCPIVTKYFENKFIPDYLSISALQNSKKNLKSEKEIPSPEKIFSRLDNLVSQDKSKIIAEKLIPNLIQFDPFICTNLRFITFIVEQAEKLDFTLRTKFYEKVSEFVAEKNEIYYKNSRTILNNLSENSKKKGLISFWN